MLNTIYSQHKLSDEVKTRIGAHQNELKRKKLPKAGKERKDRIVQKAIVDEKKTPLYMSIYSSALQVMRKYVKIFQQAEPAVFRIHTEQVDVFTEFLTNFIKPEVLSKRNSIWKLKTIDFSSTENRLPNSLLSVGSIARKIVKKFKERWRDHVRIFKQSNNCLFKVCYLYGWKITAEQWFSETVTAIDPDSILAKWTATLKAILHLPDIVTNVLSSTDLEDD